MDFLLDWYPPDVGAPNWVNKSLCVHLFLHYLLFYDLSIKAGKSVVTSCTTSYTGVPVFQLASEQAPYLFRVRFRKVYLAKWTKKEDS